MVNRFSRESCPGRRIPPSFELWIGDGLRTQERFRRVGNEWPPYSIRHGRRCGQCFWKEPCAPGIRLNWGAGPTSKTGAGTAGNYRLSVRHAKIRLPGRARSSWASSSELFTICHSDYYLERLIYPFVLWRCECSERLFSVTIIVCIISRSSGPRPARRYSINGDRDVEGANVSI